MTFDFVFFAEFGHFEGRTSASHQTHRGAGGTGINPEGSHGETHSRRRQYNVPV